MWIIIGLVLVGMLALALAAHYAWHPPAHDLLDFPPLIGRTGVVIRAVGPGLPGHVQIVDAQGHVVDVVAFPSEEFLQRQTAEGGSLLLAPGQVVTITGTYGLAVLVTAVVPLRLVK